MDLKGKELVWIYPHPDQYWFPGRLVGSNETTQELEVEDNQGTVFRVKKDSASFVSHESLMGAENMVTLGDFNEGTLLHNVNID